MMKVLLARAPDDPDPIWRRAGSFASVRLVLAYLPLGLGVLTAGLPIVWVLVAAGLMELAFLLLVQKARGQHDPSADVTLVLGGLSPLIFLAASVGMILGSGAGAAHLLMPAVCLLASFALTAINLRALRLTSERRTMRRLKAIRDADGEVHIRTARLRFGSMNKISPWVIWLGTGLPLGGLLLMLPLGPARWGLDVPEPLVLVAGYGAALLSVAFYHSFAHVIAGLRLIRAERHGPL